VRAPGAEHPCREVGNDAEPTITIVDTLSGIYNDITTFEGYEEWVRLLSAKVDAQQRLMNSRRYLDRSVQPI
jgi:hypothetical protein